MIVAARFNSSNSNSKSISTSRRSRSSSTRQPAPGFAALLWSSFLVSTCRSFLPLLPTAKIIINTNHNHYNCNGVAARTGRAAPLHYGNDRTETTPATTRSSDNANAVANDNSNANANADANSKPWATWFPNDRQILKFQEPTTNVTVLLIGAMHYNPASIRLVKNTVEDLGKTDKLASVVIESCDIRWNKTQELLLKKQKQKNQSQRTWNALNWKRNRNFANDDDSNGSDNDNDNDATVPPIAATSLPSNDKDFLGNEMRAAWEIATFYQRPTVLGDQQINTTVDALKASVKETASDLLWGGLPGWKRCGKEIATNWNKTVPIAAFGAVVANGANGANGNGNDDNNDAATDTDTDTATATPYLNAGAFFDPRLLFSLPVSLVKYPLSFLVKDPVPVGTVFALIAALNVYGTSGGDASGVASAATATATATATLPTTSIAADLSGWFADVFPTETTITAVTTAVTTMTIDYDHPWTDYLLSLVVAALETVVFARLLLKPLLADRNEILAKSVLDQCRIYSDANENANENGNGNAQNNDNWFGRFFSSLSAAAAPLDVDSNSNSKSSSDGIVYVPGSDPESITKGLVVVNANQAAGDQEKVVVAVLGMAHCNGVMKLLKEQRV